MIKNNNESGSDTPRTGSEKTNNLLFKVIVGAAGVAAIVSILAAADFLYYYFGRSYFGPKVQIILEPDYSIVSTVDPSDLEKDVEIINARSRTLGFGAPFKVAGNSQIVAHVPASTDIETLAGMVVHVGLLELVDFGAMPIPPGTKINTDSSYGYFPQAEGKQWHTIMTNSEFKSVYVTQDSIGKNAISFTLTSDGAKILTDYTTGNVGHYLGIVLDKVVLSSPQVNAPITDGQGIIQGSFTKEEAETLAAYLKVEGPLPVPLVVKEVRQMEQ